MQVPLIPKKKRKLGKTITFRPSPPVARMLERASADHPVISAVINESLLRALTAAGYARKKEEAV